jgi:hypothetical protein
VHHAKDVIQKEKDEKKAKQDANEANKVAREAQQEQSRKYLAQLEAEVANEADKNKLKYPRQKIQAKPSKRRGHFFALTNTSLTLTHNQARQQVSKRMMMNR